MVPETTRNDAPTKGELCSFCRERIEGEPVRKGDELYCSQACAFEASRRRRCDPDRIVYQG